VRQPEDPLGDLGNGRSAAERLEERDRTHPEPVQRPPETPRPGSRYAWVVGIVLLMGIGVLLLTTALPNTGEGVQGPAVGARLSTFAAPLATGNIEQGDANVCQRRPCPKNAGRVPACEVRSSAVVNLCQLRARPLVLTFVVTRGADCEPQVDRVERMRRDFPGAGFAVVMSGNSREEAEQIARRRSWSQPVAVDEDGAVVNLYGVGICPVTVFAAPGGKVVETALGNLTEDQLRSKTRHLLRRT
jgi:AhpC/TSA family protein